MNTILYNNLYSNNNNIVDLEGVAMYVIRDEATGRFLNKRSIELCGSMIFYTTYTGKIGTDFYKTLQDCEKEKARVCKICNNIGKTIHIITVNPDSMCLGNAVMEQITVRK